MKKVLVMGGNRYFGKRLVNLLLEAGNDVTVLNRGNLKDSWGNQVKRIRADRTGILRKSDHRRNHRSNF